MKPATPVLSGNSLRNNQNKKFHHFPKTLVEKRREDRVGWEWAGRRAPEEEGGSITSLEQDA